MNQLKESVAKGQAIFVVGTGFSMSSSNGSTTANWVGFIRASIHHLSDLGKVDASWINAVQALLDYALSANDTTALISAAGIVQQEVQKVGPVAVTNWLRETIGSLEAVDQSWGNALEQLGCPILTTNYDSLLEVTTGRPTATWQNSNDIQKILTNSKPAIGHLHGHWETPESVILSDSDYTRLLSSETSQELQRAASSLKSLVYVGVGAGLEDPNFSRLITWHRNSLGTSGLMHFRLCLDSELDGLKNLHADDHIVPVSYGTDYSHLPKFLESLSPQLGMEILRSESGHILDPIQIAVDALADQVRMDSIICEKSDDLESRGIEDLVVPPVLLPASAETLRATSEVVENSKFERLDPYEVSKKSGITIVVGEENAGLTTALQWLLHQAATSSSAPPVLVDFKKFSKGGKPLKNQLRYMARNMSFLPSGSKALPDLVIGIDNVSPYSRRLCDQMINDLADLEPRQSFIGCRPGDEAELVERLKFVALEPEVRYLGRFARKDVIDLVSLATKIRPDSVAENVLSVLSQQNLPRTPFIVALLANILIAGNAVSANSSHTILLDQYLSQLLGLGNIDEDARWSADSGLREAILADIAMLFVEEKVGSLSPAAVLSRIEKYFNERDILENPLDYLEYFKTQRVMRNAGNLIRFSHHSYLYLFAAKAAASYDEFRESILKDPSLYAPIIRHYASLKRQDADLLRRMRSYLEDSQTLTEDRATLRRVATIEVSDNYAVELHSEEQEERDSEPVARRESFSIEDIAQYEEEPEAFPLTLPENLPVAFRYSIILDVVSTALRDCDQVPDPELKADLLRRVLAGWGRYLGLLSADTELVEAMKVVAEKTSKMLSLDENIQEQLMRTILSIFPSVMTLSGIAASLSSRKLLKALEKATTDPEFIQDGEGVVAAALMLTDIQEDGWVASLDRVTKNHQNLEVVSQFIYELCSVIYFTSPSLSKNDEASLLRYLADLQLANKKFSHPRVRNYNHSIIINRMKNFKLKRSGLEGRELESSRELDPTVE